MSKIIACLQRLPLQGWLAAGSQHVCINLKYTNLGSCSESVQVLNHAAGKWLRSTLLTRCVSTSRGQPVPVDVIDAVLSDITLTYTVVWTLWQSVLVALPREALARTHVCTGSSLRQCGPLSQGALHVNFTTRMPVSAACGELTGLFGGPVCRTSRRRPIQPQ